MIYTVTLNPSLDYIVDVENLTVGAINRSTKEAINPAARASTCPSSFPVSAPRQR